MEVTNGFRSRSSVIGERGDDADAVDEERAADMQREKDLELWVDPNGAPVASGDPADDPEEDGIDDDEYSAPPNPTQAQQREMHLALLKRTEAETEALRARALAAKAPAPQPAPPPVDPTAAQTLALQARILDLLGEGADGGQQ